MLTRLTGAAELRRILSDESIWDQARIWCALTQPVWTAASKEYECFHGPGAASYRWCSYLSTGIYFTWLAKMWDKLENMVTLRKAGFNLDFEDEDEQKQGSDSGSALYRQEQRLSAISFNVTVETVHWRGPRMITTDIRSRSISLAT